MTMKSLRRFRSALGGASPVLLLVATLGAAAFVRRGGEDRGRLVGFAQSTPEAIAATEIARVRSVEVEIGDEVAPGQIVARLESAAIDAEIEIASAERERLAAEARVELARLEMRLDTDVEALERELSAEREEQRRVVAEEKVVGGELDRVRKLVEDRKAVLGDVTSLDLRYAAVHAIALEKPRKVELLTKQIGAAEARRKEAKRRSGTIASKLEADLALAQKKIDELERRRAGYWLRATHGGRVASIEKQPGEVAQAGEPVMRLVRAHDRVVACVPERAALGVREGDTARLSFRGRRGEPLTGKTISIGPAVSELPSRCWPNPRAPQWGREVTIALDSPVELVAGQAFDVSLEPSPSPPALTAPPRPRAIPAAEIPAARPMNVPAGILARSRFEPSGILARADESRYLIVSDDTGRGGDEGQPYLFSMSRSFAVDPEPIPIEGVAEIDDLEAITGGDAGEIYVLSSQSHSKRGKRKPARTALLRLRPDGASLRVDGEIHLAELLDADPARATSLGLSDGTSALDVEGMAFHDGALYLGLKAPLDAEGNAMIWRISKPNELFGGSVLPAKATGALEAAGISLFARARLDVAFEGRAVPGGIAELFFANDGSLAIASTPSVAEGAAGALFRVDKPAAGVLAPRLVKRFAGLKPEGIAASLDANDKLVLVFDAGAATPSWEEVAWGP